MTINPIIRLATEDDIPTLAVFEQEIAQISFGDEAVTELSHHAKRLRKSWAQNPDGMFVMEKDGGLCGWMWLDVKVNFVTQEPYVNFRSFYMEAAYRGGEDAEALLAYGLNWCERQNARLVVGKVHAGNLAMRALYRKAGFEATHITMEYRMSPP